MDPTLAALRTLSKTRISGNVLLSFGSSYGMDEENDKVPNMKANKSITEQTVIIQPVCLTQSASRLRCFFARKSICLAIRFAPTSTFSSAITAILLGRGSMYVLYALIALLPNRLSNPSGIRRTDTSMAMLKLNQSIMST